MKKKLYSYKKSGVDISLGNKFVHHFDCGECNLSYNKAHAKPMLSPW